jgi:hypothetical protein
MYLLRIVSLVLFLAGLENGQCHAQNQLLSSHIQGYSLVIPCVTFDSSAIGVYCIPLRNYGLKKANYSVLLSMTVEGETAPHHIPGIVKNDSSFDYRFKAGKKGFGDTLTIFRRSGDERIVFSKIDILAFRGTGRGGLIRQDKTFTKFVIDKFTDRSPQRTHLPTPYFSLNGQ